MKCSSCDLTILSALLIKRLKKLCFKNSSIKIYERGLNKLDLYMRQLNLSSFSKSVGLKFIEYLEKLDPKVCPKTVIKFSKTLINRLVDELNNDFKICHFPSALPIVNENFQTVIDEYCNYVSTFNSPGSVRHKRDTITISRGMEIPIPRRIYSSFAFFLNPPVFPWQEASIKGSPI